MRTPGLWLAPALGLALTTGVPAAVKAADSIALPAIQAAYIRANGLQTGNNGERFFDVEGKDTGKYACYGILRFDTAAIKSDLDKRFGGGKYKVVGVTLELSQSLAKFTKDGSVLIYSNSGVDHRFERAQISLRSEGQGASWRTGRKRQIRQERRLGRSGRGWERRERQE